MGRLFRISTRLGLLALVAYLVKRWFDGQQAPAGDGSGWSVVEAPAAVSKVPAPTTPLVPMVEPELVTIGEEPPAMAAPATKKAPAKKAPAKKAAAKKALAPRPMQPPEDTAP